MDNYKSATNPVTRLLVEQTIREEIQESNYVLTSDKPQIVSVLGAIPKPDSAEIRLIHDCSRPHGQALNDYITIVYFKYLTLDAAVKQRRPNYFMAKIDLQHAYRSVSIHPSNYKATGCKWKFKGNETFTYFYDSLLPFGCRKSPEIFHWLTQAVKRMMSRWAYEDVFVYLDDFLIVGNTKSACQVAYDTLLQLLKDLGFQISAHKLVPPTQCLTSACSSCSLASGKDISCLTVSECRLSSHQRTLNQGKNF